MMKDLIQWQHSSKPPTYMFTQQTPAGVNPKAVLPIWTVGFFLMKWTFLGLL